MENIDQYGWALASVVVVGLLAQILNALTGIRKGAKGLNPGESHGADFGDPSYRLDRAYMNSIETIGFFLAVVFVAILVGASPFWVNLLAVVHLALRVFQNVAMLRGIGKPYGGIRTQGAILSSLTVIGLAVVSLIAIVT